MIISLSDDPNIDQVCAQGVSASMLTREVISSLILWERAVLQRNIGCSDFLVLFLQVVQYNSRILIRDIKFQF